MSAKQVTWANHKGGQLVRKRTIPAPSASPRKVSRTKYSKPIAPNGMFGVIDKRHMAAYDKVSMMIRKCQKEIAELQKKYDALNKEEKNMSRQLKFSFNGQNKATLNRMKKIGTNKKGTKELLADKKMLLRQLRAKRKATGYAMRQTYQPMWHQ